MKRFLKNFFNFSLHLIWIDLIFEDSLYGAGLLSIQKGEKIKSLFSIYWYGCIKIDLLWMTIIDRFENTIFDDIKWYFRNRSYYKRISK